MRVLRSTRCQRAYERRREREKTRHLASVVVRLHVDLDLVDVADDLDVVRGLRSVQASVSASFARLEHEMRSRGDSKEELNAPG